MALTYHPYEQDFVTQVRNAGKDAYGMLAEIATSDGGGNPCRNCLKPVPKGAKMLICAARPFPALQPYAETGPIFLCADNCQAHSFGMPEVLALSPDYLLKGYSADHRIVYGTGKITPVAEIERVAAEILALESVIFVDIRSARNNCFLCRVDGGRK